VATLEHSLRRVHSTPGALALSERRLLVGLLAVAAAFTILDGAATLVWLELGQHEGNPLLARLIADLGAAPALALRVVVGLALLALLGTTLGRARLAPYAIVAVTGILLGVTLWHGYGVALLAAGLL
jgi:hypothetical protein